MFTTKAVFHSILWHRVSFSFFELFVTLENKAIAARLSMVGVRVRSQNGRRQETNRKGWVELAFVQSSIRERRLSCSH